MFGDSPEDALKAGIRTGAVAVVQGTLAHKIGDAKAKGSMSQATGLALHGLAGGLGGVILTGADGILPGAMGAMVGEGVAEYVHDGAPETLETASKAGKFTGALAGAAVDMAQGMDGTKGLAVATLTASTAVEENYLRHRTCAVPKVDEEAEESAVGKFRKGYIDAARKLPGAKAVENSFDAVGDMMAEQASWVYAGEEGYVTAKLAWAQSLKGKPLTPAEKDMLSEGFRETYQAAQDAHDMASGVAVVIPGRCTEWFLRHTGLTDKGTARAVGHVVDDALGVTAVGAVLKGAVTSAGKAVSKASNTAQRQAFQKAVKSMDRGSVERFRASANVADALRLRTELAFKQAGLLNTEGQLTERALAGSKKIDLSGGRINNPKVENVLIKDGSRIEDWAKFKTESVNMPNGQRLQIHYYRNAVTGKVDHVTPDFKVKGRVEQ